MADVAMSSLASPLQASELIVLVVLEGAQELGSRPTRILDVQSVTPLADAFFDSLGAALVIGHDLEFLGRLGVRQLIDEGG